MFYRSKEIDLSDLRGRSQVSSSLSVLVWSCNLHYNSACPSVHVRKERMRSEEYILRDRNYNTSGLSTGLSSDVVIPYSVFKSNSHGRSNTNENLLMYYDLVLSKKFLINISR